MVNLAEMYKRTYNNSIRRWVNNRYGNVRNMTLASKGMLGPNRSNNNTKMRGVNNAYKVTKNLTSKFNYLPKLNNHNYIYRGYNSKKTTFNTINTRMGMSSWSLSPNVARRFSVGKTNRTPVILRMPTRLLKNVKVGNLTTFNRGGTYRYEEEVILPPMYITFNKNSATNGIANVTNIRVNGKYVRNGSTTKTYIGRNVARELPRQFRPRRNNGIFKKLLARFKR